MARGNKAAAVAYLIDDNVGMDVTAYAELCWGEIAGDELPSGVDYFLFDCGNCVDVSNALKWLQLVLGIPVTGKPDRVTRASAYLMSPEIIITGVEIFWRRRMKSLPTWETHKRKYTNHISIVRGRALKMLEVRSVAVAS